MQIEKSLTINAPLAQVWQVAAHEFELIDAWSSGVLESEAATHSGESVGVGSPVTGRICTTRRGDVVEMFTRYDEDQHTFTYEISGDSMPGYVARTANTWTAVEISEAKTELTMDFSMELFGLSGAVMNAPMRFAMGRLMQGNLEELKHYIETGGQHPRKVKASRTSR